MACQILAYVIDTIAPCKYCFEFILIEELYILVPRIQFMPHFAVNDDQILTIVCHVLYHIASKSGKINIEPHSLECFKFK